VDDHRHVQCLAVERLAVGDAAVLEELLAVVRGEHDERLLHEPARAASASRSMPKPASARRISPS
jgi:hypothetical protein